MSYNADESYKHNGEQKKPDIHIVRFYLDKTQNWAKHICSFSEDNGMVVTQGGKGDYNDKRAQGAY